MVLFLKDNSEKKFYNSFLSSFFFFASASLDKVVTIRESLKIWVDFLTACIQSGLINVKQSCAMGSSSTCASEIFFFLFDTIPRDV